MTTAAAIDRLVHHATTIELTGKSCRTEAEDSRKKGDTKLQAKLSTTDGEE
jgi:hypothetical protein